MKWITRRPKAKVNTKNVDKIKIISNYINKLNYDKISVEYLNKSLFYSIYKEKYIIHLEYYRNGKLFISIYENHKNIYNNIGYIKQIFSKLYKLLENRY